MKRICINLNWLVYNFFLEIYMVIFLKKKDIALVEIVLVITN